MTSLTLSSHAWSSSYKSYRYYTTIFTSWVVFHMRSKLILMCKNPLHVSDVYVTHHTTRKKGNKQRDGKLRLKTGTHFKAVTYWSRESTSLHAGRKWIHTNNIRPTARDSGTGEPSLSTKQGGRQHYETGFVWEVERISKTRRRLVKSNSRLYSYLWLMPFRLHLLFHYTAALWLVNGLHLSNRQM